MSRAEDQETILSQKAQMQGAARTKLKTSQNLNIVFPSPRRAQAFYWVLKHGFNLSFLKLKRQEREAVETGHEWTWARGAAPGCACDRCDGLQSLSRPGLTLRPSARIFAPASGPAVAQVMSPSRVSTKDLLHRDWQAIAPTDLSTLRH